MMLSVAGSAGYCRCVSSTPIAETEQPPVVRHDTPEARRLADLVSVGHDLAFVIGCCGELTTLDDDDEKSRDRKAGFTQALWSSALVAYARSWANGKRLGLSEDVLDQFEGEPRQWHQTLLDLREKHVADSMNPFEEVTIGLMLSPDGSDPRRVDGVGIVTRKLVSHNRQSIQQLAQVAQAVRREVARLAEEQNAVVLEEGRQVPMSELLDREIVRASAPSPQPGSGPRST